MPFLRCFALVLALIAIEAQAADPAPFDVLEYRVLGNTTLPTESIERAVYPFLGERKSIAEVESARQSLESAYREAGYGTVFVDIPEQQIDQGIVRLRVTEGRLDRIRVTGSRYFSNGRIRAAVPALAQGAVPRLPEVQQQLSALNRETPDRAVAPVLRAGRTPGTVDVELKVSDELPLHGSMEVNDRYTADTSRLRLSGSLSYDNLFQRQHSLSLQYQTAPEEPDDVRAIVGTYVFRTPRLKDTTFAVYAVDSQTDVAALGTLSVLGTGNIYGLRAIHSLPAGVDYFHSIALGLDYKDFLENIQLSSDQKLKTPIHYLTWSATYTGTMREERSTTVFNLGANLGLRRIVNDSSEFGDKRFKGAPNFFYVRGGAQHLRRLPWDLAVFGKVAAQFTQNPLVSNEQFAIGGVDTVRGYLEASQLGDYGFNGTLELRSGLPAKSLGLSPDGAYLFAFYDAGLVSIVEPLPSQASRFDLASWGVGTRLADWHGLDFSLDWARTLVPSSNTDAGEDRVHFTVRYDF